MTSAALPRTRRAKTGTAATQLDALRQRIRYPKNEAAEMLGISPRQLDRLRARGELIARTDGSRIYFDHDELVSYARSLPAAVA